MNPMNLDQALAQATGESLREIRRLGFNIVNPLDIHLDSEPVDRPPRILNWDRVDRQRTSLFPY